MRLAINATYRPTPIPAPAASAGYTKLAFHTHFLNSSEIDVNDTRVNGFKYYTHNAWPNGQWVSGQTLNPTLPAHYTLADSVLTVITDPTHNVAAFGSAAYSENAPGYVGNIFAPGFYFEVRLRSPLGINVHSGGAWLVPIEPSIGTTSQEIEMDVVDIFDTTNYHSALVDWDFSTYPPAVRQNLWQTSAAQSFTDWHIFGFRWELMADGGGTGRFSYFIDGVEYTQAGVAPKTYTASDRLAFCEQSAGYWTALGSRDGANPIEYDYVALWNKP